MKESIDLNALRWAVTGTEQPPSETAERLAKALERDRGMNEGTVTERITALKAEIVRLEAEISRPSPVERFDTLSPEEQMSEMAQQLQGLVPEGEWNIEVYRSGLERDSKKNPFQLRLAIARERLKNLRGE